MSQSKQRRPSATRSAAEGRQAVEVGASTTFAWKRVRVRPAPAGQGDSRPKGGRWRRFPRRDHRDWITVRLKLKLGAEPWVVVDGRGEVNAYHGATQLVDLLLDINQSR